MNSLACLPGASVTVLAFVLFVADIADAQEQVVVEIADVAVIAEEAVEAIVGKAPKAPEFLKPMINTELSFIKRVCEPSHQQMEAITDAATEAHRAMHDLVQDPNERRVFQAGQIQIMGPGNERLSENPVTRIRSDAKTYLKPLVSPQQYSRYEQEAKRRAEFEHGAAVDLVVGMLDEKLVLSDDQRIKLHEKLMQQWKQLDLHWIENYVNNTQYVPPVPKGVLLEVLSSEQRAAWNAFQEVQFSLHFHSGQAGPGLGEEWIR